MEKRISIIMPVYNEQEHLKESIESILNQTFADFEYIILDDGSTDGSIKIIESYKDSRIKLIKADHQGMVHQFNYGIRIANASLIARMDADDIAEKNRFEEQIYFLKHHPEVDIVGSNVLFITENNKDVCEKKYPEYHNEIEFMMPIESSVCHPAVIIKSSVFTRHGQYNESYGYAADHKLFLDLLSEGYKFYNIQKILLKYRLRALRAEQHRVKNSNEISYRIGINYLNRIHGGKISESDDYNFNYRMGLIEYYRGSLSKARAFFRASLKSPGNKTLKVLRYYFVCLLGDNIISYLRKKKFLIRISFFINRLFRIDIHKIAK